MALQALGANSETGMVVCQGMLVRSAVQVDLSVGEKPRRVHIVLVKSEACWGVKQEGILTKPWERKCSFSAELSS